MQKPKVEEINKLFQELSQFATVPSYKEQELQRWLEHEKERAGELSIRISQLLQKTYPKKANVGGHFYPGCENPEDFHTTDCEYKCGCWMGAARSGANKKGVDQFGDCPNNPAMVCSECGQFIRPKEFREAVITNETEKYALDPTQEPRRVKEAMENLRTRIRALERYADIPSHVPTKEIFDMSAKKHT